MRISFCREGGRRQGVCRWEAVVSSERYVNMRFVSSTHGQSGLPHAVLPRSVPADRVACSLVFLVRTECQDEKNVPAEEKTTEVLNPQGLDEPGVSASAEAGEGKG